MGLAAKMRSGWGGDRQLPSNPVGVQDRAASNGWRRWTQRLSDTEAMQEGGGIYLSSAAL